jgi:ABC-type sulfate/molybdate transport systems ATPase subunit
VSLLVLEGVSKHHRRGRIERLALDDVSLELEAGELVAVWGLRRSGRTTLLRVAAGMERPDRGTVRFGRRDLAQSRDKMLGSAIGYVQLHFSPGEGESVLDQVAGGLLAERISLVAARRRALQALADTGAESCAALCPRDLDVGEAVRVAVARALVVSPLMLVVDEPTNGVDVADRDPILRLLRRVANGGVAVLMSTGDGAALAGADRVFMIDHGQLRGGVADPQAPVIPLRRPVRPAAGESRRTG